MYEYNLGLRFQAVTEEFADHISLWFNSTETITYAELNRLTNRLARWLINIGVEPQEVVCLSGEKSITTFAAILACLKIGAVYCILDPETPLQRLRKILVTCAPKLILADAPLLTRAVDLIAQLGISAIPIEAADFANAPRAPSDQNLSATRCITGANPAYIMFTSGSTGIPKGAVMTHENVLNFIAWAKQTYSISHEDVLTNVNQLYFDNSVFDFYAALFSGAQLVPFSRAEVSDPKRLVRKIDVAKCSSWFSVPSLLIFLQTMKATDRRHLRSIRRFIFGGEGYPKARLKNLFDTYADSSRFFNVYGPTECTCMCSSYEVTKEDFDDLHGFPPLGTIADNFSYLILSEDNRPAQADETGELCLLGPNVGRGYYRDPERTSVSFVQNPLNDKFVEIMYRTGDLVRLNPVDAKLYIVGRKDNQIKHLGYRIELEEIEVALHCLDYVDEAAALHINVNGWNRIVAAVALSHECEDERIRRDLQDIIPSYMLPSVFYRERALPKNANGKVDRRRLIEKYVHGKSESL